MGDDKGTPTGLEPASRVWRPMCIVGVEPTRASLPVETYSRCPDWSIPAAGLLRKLGSLTNACPRHEADQGNDECLCRSNFTRA